MQDVEAKSAYTDEEQALYDRIIGLESALEWVDCDNDTEVAQGLWQKMQTHGTQQIQCSALAAQLESLPTILSDPPGGFI